MTLCLGVDPSIATTGWALVTAPTGPDVWTPDHLVAFGTIRTKPGTPLPDRLEHLASSLYTLASLRRADLVAVEEPAIVGLYAQHRGRQRSKSTGLNADALRLLHMATAALIIGAKWAAGANGPALYLVKADHVDKRDRSRSISALVAGRQTNEHERDACVLAIRALLDRRHRPEAA